MAERPSTFGEELVHHFFAVFDNHMLAGELERGASILRTHGLNLPSFAYDDLNIAMAREWLGTLDTLAAHVPDHKRGVFERFRADLSRAEEVITHAMNMSAIAAGGSNGPDAIALTNRVTEAAKFAASMPGTDATEAAIKSFVHELKQATVDPGAIATAIDRFHPTVRTPPAPVATLQPATAAARVHALSWGDELKVYFNRVLACERSAVAFEGVYKHALEQGISILPPFSDHILTYPGLQELNRTIAEKSDLLSPAEKAAVEPLDTATADFLRAFARRNTAHGYVIDHAQRVSMDKKALDATLTHIHDAADAIAAKPWPEANIAALRSGLSGLTDHATSTESIAALIKQHTPGAAPSATGVRTAGAVLEKAKPKGMSMLAFTGSAVAIGTIGILLLNNRKDDRSPTGREPGLTPA